MMLKLKFQYFGHLVQTADSLEKTLMPGKIEGIKRGCQRMRWFDSITKSIWQAPGDGEGQGGLACCSLWGHKELDMTCWPNNSNMDENTVIGTWESTWEFPLPQWKKKNMRIDTLKKTKIVFPYVGHTFSEAAQVSAKRYFMVSDFIG